jgi:hypothetical protein
VGVLVSLTFSAAVWAADETARYYGTWTTTTVINGQKVTIRSVHDARGFHNSFRTPTGDVPAGDGTFAAVNGVWKANSPAPNDHGVYRFVDDDTVIATNAIGQTVTWLRVKHVSGSGPSRKASRRRRSGHPWRSTTQDSSPTQT